MERGYAQHAADNILAVWAANYELKPTSGPISDRAAQEAELRESLRGNTARLTVTYQLLGAKLLGPTTAEAWVRHRMTLTDGATRGSGLWTERHIWKRSTDGWRLQRVEIAKSQF
jgi:hypothetical protein